MILRTEIGLDLGMMTFKITLNTSFKIVLAGLEIEYERNCIYI